jgi:TRAP-type C4-dicarboxylate transport system permease small subunit
MRSFIRAIELAVIGLMTIVAAVVFGEVVARGVFGRSLIITDELSRYLMIWIVLLGGVLLVRDGGHIRVDVVVQSLPPRARLVLLALADLLSLVFLVTLSVISAVTTMEMRTQHTITLGTSMAWFYAALPVGGVLMALLVARDLIRRITGRDTQRP